MLKMFARQLSQFYMFAQSKMVQRTFNVVITLRLPAT